MHGKDSDISNSAGIDGERNAAAMKAEATNRLRGGEGGIRTHG
jgi:hypothetical protein